MNPIDVSSYKLYELSANESDLKIRKKTYTTALKNNYVVINYDRDIICDDDLDSGKYRSVIVSRASKNVLAFAPPKSVSLDLFQKMHPEIDARKMIVSEIVEGTMINLWFDPEIGDAGSWEISTKSAVGGNYYFYRTQYFNEEKTQDSTFRNMFLDALRAERTAAPLSAAAPMLNALPTKYCYSFVLQHPENHIVLPISTPAIYLVAVFDMSVASGIAHIPQTEFQHWKCLNEDVGGIFRFPQVFEVSELQSYADLEKLFSSPQGGYSSMGVMIQHLDTGARTKIRNVVYEEVKKLRGNNPNLQYQYLCMRRMNKVMEFIKMFPCYKNIFYKFYTQYNEFVSNVHKSYISYYVKKSGELISKKYFPHIYKIHHTLYLPSLLAGEKTIVTRRVIQKYLDALEPCEMLYFLNYELRQHSKDAKEAAESGENGREQ
jgi:hypothetical protein